MPLVDLLITVDVPEGATHFSGHLSIPDSLTWYKCEHGNWFYFNETWLTAYVPQPLTLKQVWRR